MFNFLKDKDRTPPALPEGTVRRRYVVSGRVRFTIGDKTREVGPGDTLLKQDGVRHGCTCLEAGVLLDIFTPMREDFV